MPQTEQLTAILRMRDPSYTKDGMLFFPTENEAIARVPMKRMDECPHKTTICRSCYGQWMVDYEVLHFRRESGAVFFQMEWPIDEDEE